MARQEALLRIQKTLMGRRAELRKRLGADLDDLANSKQTASDAADAAFDSTGEELASQLAELEAKELRQVEHALRRLKLGRYGSCEGCVSKIPVARLNALPYSTLCIKCQRESEHDAGWLSGRRAANWEQVSDGDGMSERDVDLADLEMDISK